MYYHLYHCPSCRYKVGIKRGDLVLCLRCGKEMNHLLPYSEVIWPSVQGSIREKYGDAVADRAGRLICFIERRPPALGHVVQMNLDLTSLVHAPDMYELGAAIFETERRLNELEPLVSARHEFFTCGKTLEALLSLYREHASPRFVPQWYEEAVQFLTEALGSLPAVEQAVGIRADIEQIIKELQARAAGYKSRPSSA